MAYETDYDYNSRELKVLRDFYILTERRDLLGKLAEVDDKIDYFEQQYFNKTGKEMRPFSIKPEDVVDG